MFWGLGFRAFKVLGFRALGFRVLAAFGLGLGFQDFAAVYLNYAYLLTLKPQLLNRTPSTLKPDTLTPLSPRVFGTYAIVPFGIILYFCSYT